MRRTLMLLSLLLLGSGCGAALPGTGSTAPAPGAPCTALEGSYTVRNSRDWADLVELGCTALTGELLIDAPGLVTLEPPSPLTSVGSLNVRSSNLLTDLGTVFPVLAEVADIDIVDNVALSRVRFPALTRVGMSLAIIGAPALAQLELPVLESVGGHVVLESTSVSQLDLPRLASCGGLTLNVNHELRGVSAPVLTSLGGLSLYDTQVQVLALPLLAAAGNLSLQGSGLETLDWPSLTAITGNLRLVENPSLVEFELPMLTSVGGELSVVANPLLRQCLVDALAAQLSAPPEILNALQNGGIPNTCP